MLIALLSLVLCAAAHECMPVQRHIDVQLQTLQYAHEKRNVEQADAGIPTAPLRVHFDTTYLTAGTTDFECTRVGQTFSLMGETYVCEAKHIVSQELKNKIIRLLDRLKREIADTFNIVRADAIQLDAYPWCYNPQKISIDAYRTRRTDLDAVFFVTAWPAKAVAWCGYCRLDRATGRPVAGHMNLNPPSIASSSDLELMNVLTHELFHGLGFESGRMQKQIRDGRLVNPVQQITYGNAEDGTWTTDVMTSPAVVREARTHFNCPTLRGVQIEDFAKQVANAPGSHWDKWTMGFEVINPTTNADDDVAGPRISRITLGFFEDSGVYYPNYKAATPFTYGLGAGCGFVERPARFREGYACKSNEMRCTADLLGIGWCAPQTYANCLPKFFQANTSDCRRGGGSQYVGNGIVEPNPMKSCTDPTLDASWNGQSGGDNGRCFMSSVAPRRSSTNGASGACYVTQCPVPGAAPEPEPAPQPAPAPQPPASRNFGLITDCEQCTKASGIWCDQGWSSSFARQGVCQAPTGTCERWQNRLTAASQCYPACTYQGRSGQCRSAPACQRAGGAVYSSKGGASGCQKEPGAVMCCIGAQTRKREEEHVEKRDVEQTGGGVRLRVGADWFTCPRQGGLLDLGAASRTSQFTGTVECPSLNDICCTHKNGCNNRGKCVRGFCACNKGWTGLECEREAEGPLLVAPSRRNWQIPAQYVMDLPSVDVPLPDDNQGVPDAVPDGFGAPFFASPDEASVSAGKGVAVDQTTVIIIVVVVVVVLLTAVGVGVTIFLLLKRKRSNTPTRA